MHIPYISFCVTSFLRKAGIRRLHHQLPLLGIWWELTDTFDLVWKRPLPRAEMKDAQHGHLKPSCSRASFGCSRSVVPSVKETQLSSDIGQTLKGAEVWLPGAEIADLATLKVAYFSLSQFAWCMSRCTRWVLSVPFHLFNRPSIRAQPPHRPIPCQRLCHSPCG